MSKRPKKESLHLCMTYDMDDRIRQLAKYDYELNMRIGEMDSKDVIAAEAMYHRSCILKLQQTARKADSGIQPDIASSSFIALCQELRFAATRGKYYSYKMYGQGTSC